MIAAGRTPFRMADLLELSRLIQAIDSGHQTTEQEDV